jgi:hypothetical protein
MKLSAENKISVKNAFNLGLIDYMAEMVRKKAPGMDNFQVNEIPILLFRTQLCVPVSAKYRLYQG